MIGYAPPDPSRKPARLQPVLDRSLFQPNLCYNIILIVLIFNPFLLPLLNDRFKAGNPAFNIVQPARSISGIILFPPGDWTRIRTSNTLERIMRETRRRTRVVGSFPDGRSGPMPSAARIGHGAGTVWRGKKYLNRELGLKKDLNREVA